MTTAVQGAMTAVYVEPGASPHTFDSSSERYECLTAAPGVQSEIVDTNGQRATRSHASERTRSGIYTVRPRLLLNPSPLDLDLWLPRILGAAESSDTFALADTLPTFGVLMDLVSQTHELKDCYVDTAIFRGSAGRLIELELQLAGTSDATGTSVPSVSLSVASNNAPYIFSDGVFTIAGSARDTLDWELTIANHLEVRFSNSRTATSITPGDRTVMQRTTHPYISGLYGLAVAGAAGSAAFTNGGLSTTFTYGVLQIPNNAPEVPGKSEIVLRLDQVARMTGSTRELVVTNDSVA
jgi:hypothetical protein